MRSVVEIGASVPAFLGKLWKLVNDSETNHLISWSPGGKTFVIKNQADFARELLPLYYKHNNMASFIRQLNMYGFHKITSVENGGLRYERDEIEFSHPCFMKGHAYLLEHIKRKIANSKSIVSSDSGDKILLKPELMNKVLADVKQMKGKQESLDAKFSAMKQENEALWREVAILRQKHIKQQQIVNNLIQFLMSLVQPARPPNANGNNVGVKRPYQLMINNAAHNLTSDNNYPGKTKNVKLDKETVLEDINEDNLEDGPTIHELAHDDILHNEASQESSDNANFVTIEVPNLDGNNVSTSQGSVDPAADIQYLVVMDDEDDSRQDTSRTVQFYPNQLNGKQTNDTLPVSPSLPTVTTPESPENVNNLMLSPGISRPKSKPTKTFASQSGKNFLSPSNYNVMNPSADLKLPAEIFASDDSVSDAGVGASDDMLMEAIIQEPSINANSDELATKDKMLGGINIKLEKASDSKSMSKKTKKVAKDDDSILNLANIKTELQDDLDWSNMTLATVNNNSNINRFQTRNNRRDHIGKSREDLAALFGTNTNKTDIDDQLDCMQTDLDSLRELLRSDSYSLDTNTLLGLFGSDDPFYGLTFNLDDRTKSDSNNVEGNQLISYTGNIPDFEDINMPELECDSSQDACISPIPSSSTLNTPQAEVRSPANWKLKP